MWMQERAYTGGKILALYVIEIKQSETTKSHVFHVTKIDQSEMFDGKRDSKG